MAPIYNPGLVKSITEIAQQCKTGGNQTRPHENKVDEDALQGGLTVASVDIIAMIVSDAGLSSANPEWWNCSPLGCFLIALQPRGGWQIIQRAVQWGDDHLTRSFGVTCDMASLYRYFACSVRNRLEVWHSSRFISPILGTDKVTSSPALTTRRCVSFNEEHGISALGAWAKHRSNRIPIPANRKKKSPSVGEWLAEGFQVEGRGRFDVHRPTKLLEGSSGGVAFMCELLKPPKNEVYSSEEQARLQMLSILLVALGLSVRQEGEKAESLLWDLLRQEFSMNAQVSSIFYPLCNSLIICDLLVIAFLFLVFYSVFRHNLFGAAAPYAVQLASLTSWSIGAMGLLVLGGNPRVKVSSDVKNTPLNLQKNLETFYSNNELLRPGIDPSMDVASGNARQAANEPNSLTSRTHSSHSHKFSTKLLTLKFGYLDGSKYRGGQGECQVTCEELETICGLEMSIHRPWHWKGILVWCMLHLVASIILQIANSNIATLGSEALGVSTLLCTSVFRGMGISGSAKWMIPRKRMRKGAVYGGA